MAVGTTNLGGRPKLIREQLTFSSLTLSIPANTVGDNEVVFASITKPNILGWEFELGGTDIQLVTSGHGISSSYNAFAYLNVKSNGVTIDSIYSYYSGLTGQVQPNVSLSRRLWVNHSENFSNRALRDIVWAGVDTTTALFSTTPLPLYNQLSFSLRVRVGELPSSAFSASAGITNNKKLYIYYYQ
jgi:hypothetical protein